ncbi:M14 family metallopeptidase [Psychroserpens sp.]|uniref:M14 family metallopeptidase n=1 Tax=Psychroserpens sp. TaxID=2020870 RepID=UPI001AFDA350|nr:M14 family metallopeptidase [Psychroserpens sp.]MBO6606266.1 M14 family metallopeptidase [Psychroserpens sp.]MBO6655120.1 M14 family metallopeptidase [Psychroserpens sp.]MBO6683290.1 M14 family metallopeptidase [Psychroserpens sp.]MBO6751383.1 M14 family metallopeptidase [Psychroserpens sp.]MBO6916779.1 M14 family metallopeptidase [Psychroserpens sp.]
MKRIIIICCLIMACNSEKKVQKFDFTTAFESSQGTETATYDETIAYYEALADSYEEIHIEAIGETDSGKPLHIVTLNADADFDFNQINKNKRVILINNGIHPGESDGIDATMMLYRDIVQGKINMPSSTVLVTIPIYNVGGSLNRNSTTRTNQNGPESYGFRGNARNYDLNRDFIKSDTKNARTFAKILHHVNPDVFIDNHVSNGADYQYTLTHLFTQHNKLGGELGAYLHESIMPSLESKLQEKSWDITPYVNVFNRTPEQGFSQFMDSPRYSTGYTTLWNTIGMMVETHMLKPYKQRVEGTYELMKSMIEITEEEGEKISELRQAAFEDYTTKSRYPLQWSIDTTQSTTLQFKGYEGRMIPSDLTGAQRLKYDRNQPFTKPVTYQNYMTPTLEVAIPKAYIIPQGWWNVIDLLELNEIEMNRLERDTVLNVTSYKIDSYDTRRQPYEGHYGHYNVSLTKTQVERTFYKGDLIVYTKQDALRYLIETLEPQGPDSFFSWNFFDTILQQKEGFSPYVWEDRAKALLIQYPKLQVDFNLKKTYDQDFANNWYAQLEWLHKQSVYYEKAHLQYPIYRLE